MSFSLWSRTRRVLCCVGLTSAVIAAGIVTATVTSRGQVLALPGATESTVVTVEPTRVLDTRYNIGLNGPFTAGTPRKLTVTGTITTYFEPTQTTTQQQVVPTGATGVLLNVTGVAPTAAGWIAVRPGNATGSSSTSNLNMVPGQVVPNAVTVEVPTTGTNAGQIDIMYGAAAGTVNIVIDIVGYTTDTGLIDLVNRVTTLENSGVAGPQGEPGTNGTNGAAGPAGPAGPLTSSCAATLRWDLPACQAATVTVEQGPNGVAFDGSYIWVANFGSNTVSKIDPTDNSVTHIAVGNNPFGVAFDGTNIWVTNFGSDTMSKINPTTNNVTKIVTSQTKPEGVAFDGTHLWVTSSQGSPSVLKITLAGTGVASVSTAQNGATGVAFDGINIWVTNQNSHTVSKIEPNTNTETGIFSLGVGANPTGVAFDGTNIWVANTGLDSVSKIDPNTNNVIAVDIGRSSDGVGFDGTNIWVTSSLSNSVSKIDPNTNNVATIDIGQTSKRVAFDGTNIWATSGDDTVTKIVPF